MAEEGELSDSLPASEVAAFATPSPRLLSPSSSSAAVRGIALARRKWFGCSPISDFEIMEKVGEGTFGEVHKARHKKSGKLVALKKILCRTEQEGFPITALREIKLLKALKHPNVVELLDMASGGGDASELYMVFVYMDHDLTGLLEKEHIKFTIPQIKCYMKQLLEGIRYLHKCTILHRDIKGSNILLNNRGELRVTDFGLSRPLEENRKNYTPGVVTRWYRPPELLYGATEYGISVDLWGAGCILAEMHIKKPLLPGESDLNQLELIARLCGTPTEENMPGINLLPDFEKIRLPTCKRHILEDFTKFDPLAADLIDKLLVLDPKKRLTAEEALNHPYFKTHPPPALPQSLPTYESCHEYDKIKGSGVMRAPHPTPREHACHSSSHSPFSPPTVTVNRERTVADKDRRDDKERHRHDDKEQRHDDRHRSRSRLRSRSRSRDRNHKSDSGDHRIRGDSYISNRTEDPRSRRIRRDYSDLDHHLRSDSHRESRRSRSRERHDHRANDDRHSNDDRRTIDDRRSGNDHRTKDDVYIPNRDRDHRSRRDK